jgi:hypothetical protein
MSPIANYTTTVTALKSIGEITGMLVAHGATHILTDYKNAEPVGIAFIITGPYGDTPFRLPANVEKVEAVLLQQLASSTYKQWDREYQAQKKAKIKEQAGKVAWRILKDWVRAQMAILETEMVTIDQIFLPYMQVDAKGKTLYEAMRDHRFQIPEHGS